MRAIRLGAATESSVHTRSFEDFHFLHWNMAACAPATDVKDDADGEPVCTLT